MFSIRFVSAFRTQKACVFPNLKTSSLLTPVISKKGNFYICNRLVCQTKQTIPQFLSTSSGGRQRSFNILGLQQIAIGALDKSALSNFWTNLLGVEKVGSYRSVKENVDEDILSLGAGAYKVEIDLMQPIDPEKAPKVHVPALNHIGLWVDNLQAAVDELSANGVVFTPGGIRKGAAGHNVAFIHPRSAVGVLVELVQAPDDVISHLSKKPDN